MKQSLDYARKGADLAKAVVILQVTLGEPRRSSERARANQRVPDKPDGSILRVYACSSDLCGHDHFDMSAYDACLGGQLSDYEGPQAESTARLLSRLGRRHYNRDELFPPRKGETL